MYHHLLQLEVHYTRTFSEFLALFVESESISAFVVESNDTLAEKLLFAWKKEKERVSSLLLVDNSFEVLCDQVFQQFLPVDA